MGRARNALRSPLGRGWDSLGRACTDLAVASAAWLLIEIVEAAFATWRNAAALALLPHSGAERAIWVLVAITVGFCEEVVFRGYQWATGRLTGWRGGSREGPGRPVRARATVILEAVFTRR